MTRGTNVSSNVNNNYRNKHLNNHHQSKSKPNLKLPVPERRQLSFFFDESQTVLRNLSPSVPTPSVRASRLNIMITHQAPFKRLLVPAAIVVAVLGTLFAMLRVAYKLHGEQAGRDAVETPATDRMPQI